MLRRRLAYLTIVLVAAAALAIVFRPSPAPVQTAVISRGNVEEVVEDEGKTRMHDHFTITATVAGELRRITLEAGDSVRAGETVAWIDPAPIDPRQRAVLEARLNGARAGARQAEALAARANADHAQTQKDLARARELFRHGITSQEALDRAVTQNEAAASQARAAASATESARFQVQEAQSALLVYRHGSSTLPTAVRAPVEGRVLRIYDPSARVVAPGAQLLEIGFTPRIEIVADFLTRDAVRIQPGMSALITDWGGSKDIRARVRLVEPGAFTKVSALGVEEQRVNVICDPTEPTVGLADAFHVNVRVVLWRGTGVLRVPVSAVFRHLGGWAVFVVDHGRARRRDLQIGHHGSAYWEVTSGLRAGERVILHPGADVEDGVRIKEDTASATE